MKITRTNPNTPEAIVLSNGATYGTGAIAVRDGRVTDWAWNEPCPWQGDDERDLYVVPENSEKVTTFSLSIDLYSIDTVRNCWELSSVHADKVRKELKWAFRSLSPALLHKAGADKDAAEVAAIEKAEAASARRARYEAARERAELLYPYDGVKVFKAHIRWALEEGVAKAALALAAHYGDLAANLRPCGGWLCHHRRIPSAWYRAYGWGPESEGELEALMGLCSTLSQPRLDAAWQVAKILAS